jgi:tRNA (guanine-N7-)-methyltransferase
MAKPHRPIRSFVKREGRMSAAQTRALKELMPVYGVDCQSPIFMDELFGRDAPRYIEIGFGMGTSLIEMAETHPEHDYLGIEVHRPGVGSLLASLHDKGLTNLRVINDDAVKVLAEHIPADSMDGAMLFFPDPWQKKKHHKRRILQVPFIQSVMRCLKQGGVFHLATDWEDYAQQMLETLTATEGLVNSVNEGYASRGQRPMTKYERRGLRLGHEVHDLIFIKQS